MACPHNRGVSCESMLGPSPKWMVGGGVDPHPHQALAPFFCQISFGDEGIFFAQVAQGGEPSVGGGLITPHRGLPVQPCTKPSLHDDSKAIKLQPCGEHVYSSTTSLPKPCHVKILPWNRSLSCLGFFLPPLFLPGSVIRPKLHESVHYSEAKNEFHRREYRDELSPFIDATHLPTINVFPKRVRVFFDCLFV